MQQPNQSKRESIMSDEYGVHYRSSDHTGWFVGVIVTLALLAIGYLVFSPNPTKSPVVEEQVRCMIANPGKDCAQITRWEPAS